MTKQSTFRLPDATLADLDIIATQLDVSRTEAICRAAAAYRATVTGLVSASDVPVPPPHKVVTDEEAIAYARLTGMIAGVPAPQSPSIATDERPATVPSGPPVVQAREDAQPVTYFGPVRFGFSNTSRLAGETLEDKDVAAPPPPSTVPSTLPVVQASPTTHAGPVTSLRSVPLAIPDLPRVHLSLNPITRGRLGRQGEGGLS